MPSPNLSLSSRARSLSHGVASIVAGGFGGGGAGFGGAGFGASAAGFAGCPAASLPGGGAAGGSPGFCSSAISVPCEDSYTYHLQGRVSNCATGAAGWGCGWGVRRPPLARFGGARTASTAPGSLVRKSHNPSADVAQALVPAVSRLVSTRAACVTRCRTKSVPLSGDAAGMSACATSYPIDEIGRASCRERV